MINISFNKGIFPDFLKVPNVILIHKKGETLVPNNYEKAMHIQTFSEKRKYCFPINLVFEIIMQLIMLL